MHAAPEAVLLALSCMHETLSSTAMKGSAEPLLLVLQSFTFNDMEWSLWDRWILEGDLTVQQVLDWFKARPLPCAASRAGWRA